MQSEPEPVTDHDERRAVKRHKLRLNRVFSAEVGVGETRRSCYLYVIDVSLGEDNQGGCRITSDLDLALDTQVHLHLLHGEPIDVEARVTWERELFGGTHVYGLQFVDLDADQVSGVRRFLDHYSPEARRRNFRLNRVISVVTEWNASPARFYALALDLSPEGMRMAVDFPLAEGDVVACKLQLDLNLPPVDVLARVQWQRETRFSRTMCGLEFVNPSPEAAERINQYLDRAMAGDITRQNIAPQMDFDETETGDEQAPADS